MPYWSPAVIPSWLSNGVTSAQIVRPANAVPVSPVSGGGAWVYGAWLQVVAANDLTAHVLTLISIGGVGNAANAQFQLGVGPAGAEAVIATYGIQDNLVVAGPPIFIPVIPAIQISANARVAVRFEADAGGITLQGVYLHFQPRPLA